MPGTFLFPDNRSTEKGSKTMAKAEYGSLVIDVSGKLGDGVFVRTQRGSVIRRPPTYKRPTSPAQQEAQDRMTAAMAAYNSLNRAQALDWNRAAEMLIAVSETSGKATNPTGQNMFLALASKYLQIHPGGSVPLVPPTEAFTSDNVVPTIVGSAGAIVFTANEPNTPPAVTEFLIQKLKNERRTPTLAYRSAGFHAFAAGSLTYPLTVPAGWYAVAYRCVNGATGQMGLTMPLGVVEVE